MKKDKKENSKRMFAYWNQQFHMDTESATAKTFWDRMEDPESLFLDDEFLNVFLDNLEREKGVRNTRRFLDK